MIHLGLDLYAPTSVGLNNQGDYLNRIVVPVGTVLISLVFKIANSCGYCKYNMTILKYLAIIGLSYR